MYLASHVQTTPQQSHTQELLPGPPGASPVPPSRPHAAPPTDPNEVVARGEAEHGVLGHVVVAVVDDAVGGVDGEVAPLVRLRAVDGVVVDGRASALRRGVRVTAEQFGSAAAAERGGAGGEGGVVSVALSW